MLNQKDVEEKKFVLYIALGNEYQKKEKPRKDSTSAPDQDLGQTRKDGASAPDQDLGQTRKDSASAPDQDLGQTRKDSTSAPMDVDPTVPDLNHDDKCLPRKRY